MTFKFLLFVLCTGFACQVVWATEHAGHNEDSYCFAAAPLAVPVFTNGAVRSLAVCQNASPVSLTNYLRVKDADIGNTLTFQIQKVSIDGTLSGFPASIGSNVGVVSPTGNTYAPTFGCLGSDPFVISVNYCTTIVQTKFNLSNATAVCHFN